MAQRSDAVGLFWQEVKVERVKKEKVIIEPPPRTWEADDYLPNYEEALKYNPVLFTDEELIASAGKIRLEFDIECYRNYTMFGFWCEDLNKYVLLENNPYTGEELNVPKLRWIIENFTIQTFNGINYDMLMVEGAFRGFGMEQLKELSDAIIQKQIDPVTGKKIKMKAADIRKQFKLKALKNVDHIDLMAVAPGDSSLKLYAASWDSKRMQDLPFKHDAILSEAQVTILRWYHGNDMHHTADMRRMLDGQIKLRYEMRDKYKVDVRSKSDAQIAEVVLRDSLQKRTGIRPQRASFTPGAIYRFQPAPWLHFKTPSMQYAFAQVCNTPFVMGNSGRISDPENIKSLRIPIGFSRYSMGMGGLHSTEKSTAHYSRGGWLLADVDVESFYPWLMMLLGIYPLQHGPIFLEIFRAIVEERLHAKHTGNKVVNASLKIVINGTYGKLGDVWSTIFRPDGTMQVCLNGQLSLLMLIEELELNNIHCVSANTDGIVVKPHETQYKAFTQIVEDWQKRTGLKMEESRYSLLASRDVNNYIAIKGKTYTDVQPDGSSVKRHTWEPGTEWKGKGVYANAWHPDSWDTSEQLKHNPVNRIVQEAVIAFLTTGTPVEATIHNCNDIRGFLTSRTVNGGAWKDGIYLGKAVRWYYSNKDDKVIVNAKNGHTVPDTLGAQPMMFIDEYDRIPADLDRNNYIERAYSELRNIGYLV